MYKKVYQLAEAKTGKSLPAKCCLIQLESPKITRNLTTAWFAKRVDERRALYETVIKQECQAR
ncbi:DUF1615 family protein [Shigella flexneri]|uniref:DUF1615 family protein n=1 Tax=Shigella flexneri TaxID=623 RepID=UPI0035620A11